MDINNSSEMQIKRLNGNKIKIERGEDPVLDERNQIYVDRAFALFDEVYDAVEVRLEEHFRKYGVQRLNDGDWLKVIIEEEGEAVQAINKLQYAEAYDEIAQVIACWVRLWYEVERMEAGRDIVERHLYGRAK